MRSIRGIVYDLERKTSTKIFKNTVGRCLKKMEYSKPWATQAPTLSEKIGFYVLDEERTKKTVDKE